MRKLYRAGLRTFIVTLIICSVGAIVLNACASRYIFSDGEIKSHYEKKNFSPFFGLVPFKGKKVHYAQTGNDSLPILLFIHGGPGAWYGWIDFVDDDTLRNNFNIISVDRLGYGKSDYGNPELSTNEQAAAIVEVVKHLPSDKKITIVGRSYGAPIAAMVSKSLNERVEKLILISPVVNPNKETFYWFSPLGKSKLISWMLPKLLNVATAEKYNHAREMKKILPEWRDVNCPTIVLSGGKDWVADTSNFRVADSLLTNCCNKRMIYLPESGHWISRENKDLVKDLILEESFQPKINLSAYPK